MIQLPENFETYAEECIVYEYYGMIWSNEYGRKNCFL